MAEKYHKQFPFIPILVFSMLFIVLDVPSILNGSYVHLYTIYISVLTSPSNT